MPGMWKKVVLKQTDEAKYIYGVKNRFRSISNTSSGFSFSGLASIDASEGKNASSDSRLNFVRLPIFIVSSMGMSCS